MEQRPLLELLELAEQRERLEAEAERLRREAGSTLRAARSAANLSQSELAALADVPQPYVSKVENGGAVSTDQLRKFHAVIETASSEASVKVTTTTTGGADGIQGRNKGTRSAKGRGSKQVAKR